MVATASIDDRPTPHTGPRPPLRTAVADRRATRRRWLHRARRAPGAGAVAVLLGIAAFSPAGAAVPISPRTLVFLVGVEVSVTATGELDVRSDSSTLQVTIRADGDFADLQARALQVARALPLPKDECARDGVNVVVDSVESASISATADTAVISLSGRVTPWACGHGFGELVKTKAPSTGTTVTFPVRLVVLAPTGVGLSLAGPTAVVLGDASATAAAGALTGDIGSMLAPSLAVALDGARAKAVIPPLPGLTASLADARLYQEGTTLKVKVDARAELTSETLNALLDRIGPKR